MKLKLDDCPPGLFQFEGELCLKTEYMTKRSDGGYKCDCYIIATGEYFAGGVSECHRGDLIVEPVWASSTEPLSDDHISASMSG